ncbi:MAG: hypothetical protein MZV64_46685 [Ignavibacteriales bacterium]|nr:hypothetical protein [Ignavibacteriales bacterium]
MLAVKVLTKEAVIADKLAKIVIYTGGIATIIAMLFAILLLFLQKHLPLWFGSEGKESSQVKS